MTEPESPSAALAAFAARLQFEDIPHAVRRRTEDLYLDWYGSALAGRGSRAVQSIEKFAALMGPANLPASSSSEVLTTRVRTSPLFAAMINAAASHIVEQDDVHNGSVFHPGAVVFPPHLPLHRRSVRPERT